MKWPDALQEIIDEFKEIEDQFEKLEILMDFSSEVDELPTSDWNDDTLVKGCQSVAHVKIDINDGKVWLKSAADAKMVQGLQGILTIAINGNGNAMAMERVVAMAIVMTMTMAMAMALVLTMAMAIAR